MKRILYAAVAALASTLLHTGCGGPNIDELI